VLSIRSQRRFSGAGIAMNTAIVPEAMRARENGTKKRGTCYVNGIKAEWQWRHRGRKNDNAKATTCEDGIVSQAE